MLHDIGEGASGLSALQCRFPTETLEPLRYWLRRLRGSPALLVIEVHARLLRS